MRSLKNFIFLSNNSSFPTCSSWEKNEGEEKKKHLSSVKQKLSRCWCFATTYPNQCLLSADNSQPITGVGPQVLLDRFITTNRRGQPQVIHQGRSVSGGSKIKSSPALALCRGYDSVQTHYGLVQGCNSVCILRDRLHTESAGKIIRTRLFFLTFPGDFSFEFTQ